MASWRRQWLSHRCRSLGTERFALAQRLGASGAMGNVDVPGPAQAEAAASAGKEASAMPAYPLGPMDYAIHCAPRTG
jgi:hypothetical protein